MSAIKYTCPCCGHRTLPEPGAYEICPVCLWVDDGWTSSDPQATQWGEGPNGISLAEGQARYRRDGRTGWDETGGGQVERPPAADEPIDPEWQPYRETDEQFAAAYLWRDVLTWAAGWGDVVRADGDETVIRNRRYGREEVLSFGPKEWSDFVYYGDWFAGQRDPKIYDARLSWAAVDLLWEYLGSKGSPLVVKDGRLQAKQSE